MNRRVLTARDEKFIRDARICRVATISPNGTPHVAPLCHVYVGNDTAYINPSAGGRTTANIKRNDAVALLVDSYYEDWNRLRGYILKGRGEVVTSGEELKKIPKEFHAKYRQYDELGWHVDFLIRLKFDRVKEIK
jgi:nitroimidazol reductase NimA-like FMN-containing flavoprotein (pyridoxamine 5'-phosphate oxidase superfamily)